MSVFAGRMGRDGDVRTVVSKREDEDEEIRGGEEDSQVEDE